MRFLQFALILLLAAGAFADSITVEDLPLAFLHQCEDAKIYWHDAFIRVRAGGIEPLLLDMLPPNTVTYGCASQTQNWILIVHSFVEGTPQDFTVIPKQWAAKIVKLEEKQEENEKPQGTENAER